MRLAIFCDESVHRGKFFSNFYGGALVEEQKLPAVNHALSTKMQQLNLTGEVKFTKITEAYKDKYIALMQTFFVLIASGDVKVRIMFTHNIDLPKNLTKAQRKQEYFILYYYLLKEAFGLPFIPGKTPVSLRLYLDQLPKNKNEVDTFKQIICRLPNDRKFNARGISIAPHDITEIQSQKHEVLQCLDVVLGAIQFRLNNHHKEIPAGKRRRAKRTRAKESVYKEINRLIKTLYPDYLFNVGENTHQNKEPEYRWINPYRHWKFTPKDKTRNPNYLPKNK